MINMSEFAFGDYTNSGVFEKNGVYCNYNSTTHKADFVLVSCPSTLDSGSDITDFSPALGCIYVASAVAAENLFGVQRSFFVKYIDGQFGWSPKQIADEISTEKTSLVGINYIHRTSSITESIIELLNTKDSHPRIIIGGINSILNAKKILAKYPDIICCTGEGEKVIRQLLMGDTLKNIDGISYIQNNRIVVNRPIMLRIDSDEDVPVLYKQFGAIYKNEKSEIEAAMLTTRGCPWVCSFCSTPRSMGKARYRKMSRIIQDIEYLHYEHRVKVIHIYDDIFIINKKRAKQFVEAIRARNLDGKLSFKVLARADVICRFSKGLLCDLKRSGVDRVAIGIESGNNQLLNKIKKGISTNKVIYALRLLKHAGIKTRGFFMFGLPDETVQEMEETYHFAVYLHKKGLLDTGVAHFAKVYPGTDWEQEAMDKGKILALSDNYIPVVSFDGTKIQRNSAIPNEALSGVDKFVVLGYVEKTNKVFTKKLNNGKFLEGKSSKRKYTYKLGH